MTDKSIRVPLAKRVLKTARRWWTSLKGQTGKKDRQSVAHSRAIVAENAREATEIRTEGEIKINRQADTAEGQDSKTLRGLSPFPNKFTIALVEDEKHANSALKYIIDGAVGLDTEFTDRRPTKEERLIEVKLPKGSAARKAAILGWQIVELGSGDGFAVAWDNIGLRTIQIARAETVWVLDMRKIRAIPEELRRILTSDAIKKTGVGLTSDITVLWDDLRVEPRMLVDAGMMGKLAMAERYPKGSYGNLSLKTCVEDVLGFELDKELTTSDWNADELSQEQIKYAATDAIAALRLHEVLEEEIDRKATRIEQSIPSAWYTFNSRCGEPTRLKLSAEGTEIGWKTSDCTWYAGGKFQGYP